jgi:branched-chain amino acid transport system substrate-binding protein
VLPVKEGPYTDERAPAVTTIEPVPHPPSKASMWDPVRGRRGLALAVSVIMLLAVLSTIVVLAPSPETVSIAVILPYEEGPFSHTAEITTAMQMAIDELNKWGGIGNVRLEMVVEEVLPTPEATTVTFEEVESEHNPVAYVTVSCPMMAVLSPLAEAASVPLLGMAFSSTTAAEYEWVYRYFTTAESEVVSAMEILGMLNVTSSLGILYSTSPHGCGIHDILSAAFESAGGTVHSEPCAPQETDFSTEISNLTSTEAIFMVGSCDVLVEMASALADSAFDGYALTASCGSSPNLYSLLDLDPLYVSAPSLYKVENLLALDFSRKYENLTSVPLTHHGATAYDVVYLVHGLLEGHEVSRDILGYQLSHGFVFSGVMGSMRMDSGVHDFEFPVYPAMISEGELSYL